MDVVVKEEVLEPCTENRASENIPSMENIGSPVSVVELSSDSSSVSDSEGSTDSSTLGPYGNKRMRVSSNGGVDDDEVLKKKKKKSKIQNLGFVLPIGFLEPLNKIQYLPKPQSIPIPEPEVETQCQPESQFSAAEAAVVPSVVRSGGCKQFWKAGEYDGNSAVDSSSSFGGMDHVRVHPKFLHSNATSHKWALGAFAELLDNSLDEICHGATFVNVDMLENKKDMSRMLVVEDNGGGMSPDRMRHCMSLGYSAKSKSANTIGQYGNGFKTSTMRLGGDVIVFSRCVGKDDKSPTQSIGLLSYTFLKNTGKEDIVVPMLDYEKDGQDWSKMVRSTIVDWNRNVETVVEWSPYSSEAELLHQFDLMKDQGTRVVIYNLWEDDGGELELDFDTDKHDIQIRGVNRDEKKIEMAKQFPNSRHFLTYRHSLRSYSSILYLRLPPGFRITLRGQDVDHHNIVNDMMMMQEVTYRPQVLADGVSKDPNMFAVVKLGFVKDAKDHIDVQGFNVYHKNRLIKPFWRVWNAAGSDGRGVIGVLEANFVEPAHDKQGFERTTVLSRLEQKLVQIQKTYWSTKCHEIGYAPRRHKKKIAESSAENVPQPSPQPSQPSPQPSSQPPKKSNLDSTHVRSRRKEHVEGDPKHGNGPLHHKEEIQSGINTRSKSSCLKPTSASTETMGNVSSEKASPVHNNSEWEHSPAPNGRINRIATPLQSKGTGFTYNGSGGLASCNSYSHRRNPLEIENQELKDRLNNMEAKFSRDLQFERDKCKILENQVNGISPSSSDALVYQFKVENHDLKERLRTLEESLSHDLQFERERCQSIEAKLEESKQKIEEMNREEEALIEIFSEERCRRDNEEESLRNKLKDASNTIQGLLDKVVMLEKMKGPLQCKPETR